MDLLFFFGLREVGMNWPRGLLRTWLVITAGWLIVALTLLFLGWPDDPTRLQKHLLETVTFAVVWPAALFAIGWAALWIARGFNRD